MTRLPKNFDLPTSPLPGRRFVPLKTRNPDEKDRRQRLAPGKLVLEQQRDGLRTSRLVLQDIAGNPEALRFAVPLIATAALNSVWYQTAEDQRNIPESIRRRVLKLPVLSEYSDVNAVLAGVIRGFERAEPFARGVILLHGTGTAELHRQKRDFGKTLGTAALTAACVVPLLDKPMPPTQKQAQLDSREYSIQLAEGRDAMERQIGSIPSLAQMAEPYSDLSVHWRRNAPDEAHEAYTRAQFSIMT